MKLNLKLFGYTLSMPSEASLLFFLCFLILLALITAWVLTCTDFVKEAHTNNTGRAGLKYIIASVLTLVVMFLSIRGALYNVWPPSYFIEGILLSITVLLGFGSWDIRNAYKSGIVKTKPNSDITINQEPNA